jgi:PAS domain S-box-containing protein
MKQFKQIERLFENAPIGIFETTLEGQFLDLNNELVKILGYNSKQEVFDNIKSLEEDLYEKPEMRDEVLKAIQGKEELSVFEYRFKKKDKSIIDVRLSIRPFWNDDQQKFNNVGIVEDITELKKVKRKQEEQESRYKLLYENSNDAILIYKYDQLIEYNDKALEIFNSRKNPEFIKNFDNLNPKKQPDGRISSIAAEELVNKCLNGEPQFFEWVHLKANGTPFYAEVSLSEIPSIEDGLHQAIIRDIDDKKRALLKVTESEEKYRSLIELAPDGIFTLNDQGFITSVNKAFCQLGGYEENKYLNLHFTEAFDLEKNSMSGVIELFKYMKNKNESQSIEVNWIHKSGSKHSGIAHAKSFENYQKERIIQVFLRDSTQQKKAIAKIISSESLLKSIIDSTVTEMWVIDFQGKIIEQSGFSKKRWGNLTSQNISSFPDKKLQRLFKEVPIRELKKGKIIEKSYQSEYKGKPVYFKVIWSPYKERETIKGYVVYSYDLTAEKELQDKLEAHQKDLENEVKKRTEEIRALNSELLVSNEYLNELNQELQTQKEELQEALKTLKTTQSQLIQSEKMASIGVLTSGIAHEINNPINFISSGVTGLKMALENLLDYVNQTEYHCINQDNQMCESLLKELKTKHNVVKAMENIPKLLQPIQNGIDRTTEIIKGLRIFSRLDNEERTIANIEDIIDSTLVILKNKYKNRIEIIQELDNQKELLCFPGKLGQVILNITMNAVQAIDDKGTIKINTWVDKQKELYNIIISDTGEGMDENTREKIFDPFFTTKPVGIGTGIGLSIVHGIIEDHGGKIRVESEPGKGAAFFISLPNK